MPASNNFDTILRNNFGAIIIALLVVSYYIFKTYYKTVKRKLSFEFTKYTSPKVSINLPFALTEGTNPQHMHIKCYGGSYVIVKHPELAWKIITNTDIFESFTFTSQTFNLSLNLLGICNETKKFKKLLNAVLRTRTNPPEEQFTNDVPRNSIEYPIHSNELAGQTKVVIPSTLANNGKKPYSPKLYPSLATNESNDTETRAGEYPSGQAVQKSKSQINPNMELLLPELPERFVERKEHKALKECYYNISEPFTLMKVQTEHLTGSDTRVMNSNNTLITQKSPRLNANEKTIGIRQATLRQLESSFLLAKYCIKELIVLLEAKSNRRDTVDINRFSYRHSVNMLGVCLFGKHISQLSSSRCQFYRICDHLIEILREQQQNKLVRYFDDLRRHFQSPKRQDRRIRDIVKFFNCVADDCLAGRCEGYENSLVRFLFQQIIDESDSERDHYEQLKGTISAFLISFSFNVLEILSGNLSLIIHRLAKDVDLQEKIRTTNEVAFDLEGFPLLNSKNLSKSSIVDSIIEEALENHTVDPITPFICKYPHRIPETKIRINPTCVMLIPRHVLRSSQQIDCKGKWPEQETPPGSFIVDLETQSFNLFVEQFVKICLKLSVTSLLQQYIFTVDETSIDQQDETENTSCRFTTLSSNIFVTVNRVDKRGKVITFEESLKAFHAMKNGPLSWRSILSKCFPLISL